MYKMMKDKQAYINGFIQIWLSFLFLSPISEDNEYEPLSQN